MSPYSLLLVFALLPVLSHRPAAVSPAAEPAKPIRAKYLLSVADDFLVDVYHNGKCVPASRRHLLSERFGATAERIDVEVRPGDWLVFNVVNNRLRWGGAYYFALAGCYARDEFGFVSQLDSGAWSACDTPHDADRFVTQKTYFRHHPAQPVAQPWAEGDGLMRQLAGQSWKGVPLWGTSRNTWLKVIVE